MHRYRPTVATDDDEASAEVKAKAEGLMVFMGRITPTVVTFQVTSGTKPDEEYPVVYDRQNHTWRCGCVSGFYGSDHGTIVCSHIQAARDELGTKS